MVKEKFKNEQSTRTFRRIDEYHPLDIFIGYNNQNNPTMIITVNSQKMDIESSHSIEVKLYKKGENQINLSFSLLDSVMEPIFYKFCEDIIESSRNISKANALNYIVARWNKWKLMFKKDLHGLLNENEILGLLGELNFLKNNMISKYGENAAINSWMGPEMAHKDFEIKDTWYEVKTIRSGSLTIKISSVEQLISDNVGYLCLFIMERTNENSNKGITLNAYINEIVNGLDSFENQLKLRNKLLELGYCYNDEYDKYVYRVSNKIVYKVDDDFPKLRKEDLGKSIVKASYEILIDEINEYIEVGE